jgi:hypothetical protein
VTQYYITTIYSEKEKTLQKIKTKQVVKELSSLQPWFSLLMELLIGQSNGVIQVMDATIGNATSGTYKKYSQPLKISENSNP